MALGKIAGGIAALSQAGALKRQAAEFGRMAGNWEDYQISEQAKKMLGQAEARAGAAMPGMGIAQAQQLGANANMLAAANRRLTSGSDFMTLSAALQGGAQQSALGLAQQQAQFNIQGQAAADQARTVMMGEEQKRFQNQLARHQFYKEGQISAEQARRQNIMGGISSIGAGISDIALTAAGGGAFGPESFMTKLFGGKKTT